jgi:hypothetical protein
VGPPNGSEKGAPKRCRWQRVRSPGGWLAPTPADDIPRPSRWRTPEQEGRPALLHPPRPPCAGGSRAQPGPRWAGLRLARRLPRRGPRPHPLRPPLGSRTHPRPERRGGADTPAPARRPAAPAFLAAAGRVVPRVARTGSCAATQEPARRLARPARRRQSARRWAVPCHGAWQGSPGERGRCGSVKGAGSSPAGARRPRLRAAPPPPLDPASTPGSLLLAAGLTPWRATTST